MALMHLCRHFGKLAARNTFNTSMITNFKDSDIKTLKESHASTSLGSVTQDNFFLQFDNSSNIFKNILSLLNLLKRAINLAIKLHSKTEVSKPSKKDYGELLKLDLIQ